MPVCNFRLRRQKVRRSSSCQEQQGALSEINLELSPSFYAKPTKDEFLQVPSKKRRLDAKSFAEDDPSDFPDSPIVGRRLWDSIKSSYNYLMDEGIIKTCQSTESHLSLDDPELVQIRRMSLTDFYQQFKELTDWLTQIQERYRRAGTGRSERYLYQTYYDELLQRTPRRNLFTEYAESLMARYPEMTTEIKLRLARLNEQWAAVEAHGPPLCFTSMPAQTIQDITADVQDIDAWLHSLTQDLATSQEWIHSISVMSPLQVQEKQRELTIRQTEIESHTRLISAVLKLIDKLWNFLDSQEPSTEEGDSGPGPERVGEWRTRLGELRQLTKQLQKRCHEAWLHSLELLYCVEQPGLFEDKRQASHLLYGASSSNESLGEAYNDDPHRRVKDLKDSSCQSDTPPPPVTAVSSSWGQESGFVSELSPANCRGGLRRGGHRGETGSDRTTPPLSSCDGSLDILPFSEDEYEKIAQVSSHEDIFSCDDLSSVGQKTATVRPTPRVATDIIKSIESDLAKRSEMRANGDTPKSENGEVHQDEKIMQEDLLRLRREILLEKDQCHLDDTLSRGFVARETRTRDTLINRKRNTASHVVNGPDSNGASGGMQTVSEGDLCTFMTDVNHSFDTLCSFDSPASLDVLAGEDDYECSRMVPGSGYALEIRHLRGGLVSTPYKAFYKMTTVDNEFTQDLEEHRHDATRRNGTAEDKENSLVIDEEANLENEVTPFTYDDYRKSLLSARLDDTIERLTSSLNSADGSELHYECSEPKLFAAARALNGDGWHMDRRRQRHQRSHRAQNQKDIENERRRRYMEKRGKKRRYSRSFSGASGGSTAGHRMQLLNGSRANGEERRMTWKSSPGVGMGEVDDDDDRSESEHPGWRQYVDELLLQPGSSLVHRSSDVNNSADNEQSGGVSLSSTEEEEDTGLASASLPRENKDRTDSGHSRHRRLSYVKLAEKAEALLNEHRSSLPNLDCQGIRHPEGYDSLEGWDNYQAPPYPTVSEYDEERLDLQWDETLEAGLESGMQSRPTTLPTSSRVPTELPKDSLLFGNLEEYDTMDTDEDAATEMTTNSAAYANSPSNGVDSWSVNSQSDTYFTIERLLGQSAQRLERTRVSMEQGSGFGGGRDDGPQQQLFDTVVEAKRMGDLKTICAKNIALMEKIRHRPDFEKTDRHLVQRLDALCEAWAALMNEAALRQEALEGLTEVHRQASGIHSEVNNVRHLLDQSADKLFMDRADLDKHVNELRYYENRLGSWITDLESMERRLSVDLMSCAPSSINATQRTYRDELGIMRELVASVASRNSTVLCDVEMLSSKCQEVQDLCHECDRVLAQEKHHLRCSKLALELIARSEIDTVVSDLKELCDNVGQCEQRLSRASLVLGSVRARLSSEHYTQVTARLESLARDASVVKAQCAALVRQLKMRRTGSVVGDNQGNIGSADLSQDGTSRILQTDSFLHPSASSQPSSSSTPFHTAPLTTERSTGLCAAFKRTLPYQLALLLFLGLAYLLLRDGQCGTSFLRHPFSPTLRYHDKPPF